MVNYCPLSHMPGSDWMQRLKDLVGDFLLQEDPQQYFKFKTVSRYVFPSFWAYQYPHPCSSLPILVLGMKTSQIL